MNNNNQLNNNSLEDVSFNIACKMIEEFEPQHFKPFVSILDHVHPNKLLETALQINKIDVLPYLLNHRDFDRLYIDKNGNTPLHLACQYNNVTLVNQLISPPANIKANINKNNNAGRTPLHEAISGLKKDPSYIECVAPLVPHANLFVKDKNNQTVSELFFDVIGKKDKNNISFFKEQIDMVEIVKLQFLASNIMETSPYGKDTKKLLTAIISTEAEKAELSQKYEAVLNKFEKITALISGTTLDIRQIQTQIDQIANALKLKKTPTKNTLAHKSTIITSHKKIAQTLTDIQDYYHNISLKTDEINALKAKIAPNLGSYDIVSSRADIGAIKVKNKEISTTINTVYVKILELQKLLENKDYIKALNAFKLKAISVAISVAHFIQHFILIEENETALKLIASELKNLTTLEIEALLSCAMEKSNIEVINALLKSTYFSSNEALPEALVSPKNRVSAYLINHDTFDINQIDNHGKTPLHYACSFYDLDIIKMLFSNPSININAQDKLGCTPLMNLISNLNNHPHYLDAIFLFFQREELDLALQDRESKTISDYLDATTLFTNNISNHEIREKIYFIKYKILNHFSVMYKSDSEENYTNTDYTDSCFYSSEDEDIAEKNSENSPSTFFTRHSSVYNLPTFFESSAKKSNNQSIEATPKLEEKSSVAQKKITAIAQLKKQLNKIRFPKETKKANKPTPRRPSSFTHFQEPPASQWCNYFSTKNAQINIIESKKNHGFKFYSFVDLSNIAFKDERFRKFVHKKLHDGFRSKDIPRLKTEKGKYSCWVKLPGDNEPTEHFFTREIKYKHSEDRILGFSLKAQNSRDQIIVFCHYLVDGLHTNASIKDTSKATNHLTIHWPKDKEIQVIESISFKR